jgi:hypothetical protein
MRRNVNGSMGRGRGRVEEKEGDFEFRISQDLCRVGENEVENERGES